MLFEPRVDDHLVYMSASVLPSTTANSIHVMKMSDAFASLGLRVNLIGLRPAADALTEAELRHAYAVSERFSLHRIPMDALLGYRLRYALGFLTGALAPREALIYTRVPKIAAMAAVLRRRCVLELHHPPTRTDSDALRRHLLSPHGGWLVVITHSLHKWVVEHLEVDPSLVIVAPDAANPIDPTISPALSPSTRLRVGYLGQLYPGKGIELIQRLAPQLPDVDFVIVGGRETELRYWRAIMAPFENIKFIGQVPHSETPAWLKSFDIALLPNQTSVTISHGDADIGRWTSPLKAFEYMSATLPIIASDQENLREVFVHGKTALLCPSNDAAAWAAAIRYLTGHPGIRHKLGKAALKEFQDRHTWRARASFLYDMIMYSREKRPYI